MIEAMKQAREVIELGDDASLAQRYAVLTNIDQAIAEAEKQEPVVHQDWCASLTQLLLSMPPQKAPCNCQPPKRKWVGLEDEDVATVKNEFNRGALWAEKVLKEKNT